LKTQYEFIHFELFKKLEKTELWAMRNNRSSEVLGCIKWYPAWRQYCLLIKPFDPTAEMVFSKGCLVDIADFIRQLEEKRQGKNIITGGIR